MKKFIIKPRVIELYEIVKVRVVLLYHTYEVNYQFSENVVGTIFMTCVNGNYPEVGDFICMNPHTPQLIKKDELHYYKESD
jgi:hypothetical protein